MAMRIGVQVLLQKWRALVFGARGILSELEPDCECRELIIKRMPVRTVSGREKSSTCCLEKLHYHVLVVFFHSAFCQAPLREYTRGKVVNDSVLFQRVGLEHAGTTIGRAAETKQGNVPWVEVTTKNHTTKEHPPLLLFFLLSWPYCRTRFCSTPASILLQPKSSSGSCRGSLSAGAGFLVE